MPGMVALYHTHRARSTQSSPVPNLCVMCRQDPTGSRVGRPCCFRQTSPQGAQPRRGLHLAAGWPLISSRVGARSAAADLVAERPCGPISFGGCRRRSQRRPTVNGSGYEVEALSGLAAPEGLASCNGHISAA